VFLKFLAPVKYDVEPTLGAVLVLFSYFVFFFAGTFLYSYMTRFRLSDAGWSDQRGWLGRALSRVHVRPIYAVFLILAVGGLGLRYYDLIVVKSYFSFSSMADFKINYDESIVAYGPASIISAIFAPFAVALAMLTIYFRHRLRWHYKGVSSLLFVGFLAYFVLRGGRAAITLALFMCLTTWVLSAKPAWIHLDKRFLKKFALVAIVVLLFFLYSATLLVDRLETMGLSIITGLEYLETAHHLTINEGLMELAEKSELVGTIVYALVSLTHYFVHGYYQFFLLYQSFGLDNLTYGASQFYPIFKFFRVLGFETVSAADLVSILEEPGVYTTFFGPVFMDFGYWGFLYCFILGLICQLSWTKAVRSDLFHLLVYPYCAAVIIHSSFLNMIQSGMGMYFLVAMLMAGYILKASSKYFVTATDEREKVYFEEKTINRM
jgi:hypothetical protein